MGQRKNTLPVLNISFSDLNGKTVDNKLFQLLDRNFDIIINDQNPDYCIYSVFGNDYLKHCDCIRIFYTPENLRPDFNLCDYAFSFDWLEFGDRHFRAPNYILFNEWIDLCDRKHSLITPETLPAKNRFCNFIYSHGHGHPFRDEFFDKLNRIKKVESLGAHLRNTYEDVGPPYAGDWAGQKVAIQRNYKFTIAFENSSSPGYTTEKLVHALAADTIPVYWGDPEVDRTFNSDRLINLNLMSVDEAIDLVIKLDNDDSLFLEYVNRPFFTNNIVPQDLTQSALLDKFEQIFTQPKEKAYRRNFYFWAEKYEAQKIREVNAAKKYEQELWNNRFIFAIDEISKLIPSGSIFILADNNEWGSENSVAGRTHIPFTEKDGQFWGAPYNDAAGIEEINRQVNNGVDFIVFAWQALWMLDFYAE